jgi:hypothetical protein
MTAAETLTLSFKLKQQKMLNERDNWNPRDPRHELQDWIQLKQHSEHSRNKSSIIIKKQVTYSFFKISTVRTVP